MSADLVAFPIPVETIEELTAYGAIDIDACLQDLFEITKNGGSSGSPAYDAGASRMVSVQLLKKILGIPYEITDGAKRTALRTGTNYVNPAYTPDTYYQIMTLNLPAGEYENAYFIGYDTENTNAMYLFTYKRISGALKWVRMPINLSTATA